MTTAPLLNVQEKSYAIGDVRVDHLDQFLTTITRAAPFKINYKWKESLAVAIYMENDGFFPPHL